MCCLKKMNKKIKRFLIIGSEFNSEISNISFPKSLTQSRKRAIISIILVISLIFLTLLSTASPNEEKTEKSVLQALEKTKEITVVIKLKDRHSQEQIINAQKVERDLEDAPLGR